MTYFELVTYLESLVNKTNILDEDVAKINNSTISLSGDRYYRFIDQLNYLMSERIANFKSRILDKFEAAYLDNDALILTMSTIKPEIESLYKLLNINYILNENKEEYKKSIPEEINKLLNIFIDYFDDAERKNIILGYKMEEM